MKVARSFDALPMRTAQARSSVLTVVFGAWAVLVFAGFAQPAIAQCPGVPAAGCCDNDVYTSCSGTTPVQTNCAAQGQACGEPNAFPGAVGCFDPFLIGPVDHTCQACTPDCAGKACGDDGCGGVCGECGANTTCDAAGQCQALPNCNQILDGCCSGDLYITCLGDTPEVQSCTEQGLECGASLADGFVGCQDSFNVIPGTSDCPAPCTPQCEGKVCGDDGCGGECGVCTGEGEFCNAEQTECITCEPQCDGRVCGFDTCGGTCGTCSGEGEVCNADGQCEVPVRTCENIPSGGCCEDGIYKTCDDGPHSEIRCSDFDAQCGASWTSGMAGCWSDEQYAQPSECGCIPQCDGKTCGDDGCGGVCGTCALGAECTFEGQCEYRGCPDVPNRRCCTGEVLTDCSPDGSLQVDCAGRNQYCGWNTEQNLYGCIDFPNVVDDIDSTPRNCPTAPVCTPNCDGRTCGSDGCGGSCGTCADGVACDFRSGQCVEETVCSESALQRGGCCVGTRLLSCSSTTDHPTLIECPSIENANGTFERACGFSGSTNRLACISAAAAQVQAQSPNFQLQCNSSLCIPQCFEGDTCGPDGCGGVCGVCSAVDGLFCVPDDDGTGGTCQAPCSPNCNGRTCGDNGCGGECGTCDSSQDCQEYENGQSSCVDANRCEGLDEGQGCCGAQGILRTCTRGRLQSAGCGSIQRCGWSDTEETYQCGILSGASDPAGEQPRFCSDFVCEPNCLQRECGPDGCGGSCGTCASNEQCNIQRSAYLSVCSEATLAAYQNSTVAVPVAGCCASAAALPYGYPTGETSADSYHLTSTYAGRSLLEVNACEFGCGFDADMQRYRCSTEAGELPAADPNGEYEATCPAPTCTPFCNGRNCGDDGCGGSCGTCAGTDECYSGRCGSPCLNERDETGNVFLHRGRCQGSYLSYCESGLPYEEDCSLTSGFCGWNAAINSYSCGTEGEWEPDLSEFAVRTYDCQWADGTCGVNPRCPTPTKGCGDGQTCSESTSLYQHVGGDFVRRTESVVGTCLDTPPTRAGSCENGCGRYFSTCSCYAGCEEDGNCCPDYEYECRGGEPPAATCGDGFCFYDGGEDCASCASDCGTCDYSFVLPPWKAPFPLVDAALAGGSRAVSAAHPLDDILPPKAPLPHSGLMQHLARPLVNLGPQGSLGQWDRETSTTTVFPKTVAGAVGDGMRFWEKVNNAYSRGDGDFTWTPDGYFPRPKDGNEPGGMTVAMWVKIPTDLGDNTVNTLWNAEAAYSNTTWDVMRKCVAPRRGASQVTVTCNEQGQSIQDVTVYAGEIEGLAQPSGTCQALDDVAIEGGCRAEGATAAALELCVGQTSCTITVPDAIEGCDRDVPPTVYAEALCTWNDPTPSKGATFLVRPKADSYKLAFNSVASTLTSEVGLTAGKWHHVAIAFQPRTTPFEHLGKTAGIARLFIDGAMVGQHETFKIDRLRRARMQPPVSEVVLDAETLQAAGTQVGLFSDVDEVMVYDRSLSRQELSRMVESGRQKLLRVWPEEGAANVARNNAEVLPVVVEAPHLKAVDRRDVAKTVRREDVAFRVTEGETLTFTEDENHGLSDLNTYTAMAWVRKPTGSTTATLMALGDTDADSALKVELDTTCGGRGVLTTFATTSTVPQTVCSHGIEVGQWALVAVTQSDSHRTVYVDGVRIGQTSVTSSTPLFSAAGSPRVSFSDVDVYWSGLFGKALAQADISLWFRAGPVLWTDGATYSPATANKQLVRDYAMFQERGSPLQTPTIWQNGVAVTATNSAAPLVLNRTTGHQLTVPANAFFPRVVGTETLPSAPRQFSVVTRQPVGAGGPFPIVDLVDTVDDRHVTLFRADVFCSESNRCLIRGRARAVGPDVSASRDELSFVTASFEMGASGVGSELTVALSFDGRHVNASLGGLPGEFSGAELDTAQRLEVTETLTARALPSAAAAPSALTGSFFRLSAERVVEQTLTVSEFRLYGRSMSTAELAVLNSRSCDDAGCGGRGLVCASDSDTALPTCMGCADGYVALSSSADASCVPLRRFNGACEIDQQCVSGDCVAGFCTERDRATCDVACDDLGRSCENSYSSFGEDSASHYQCSYRCKPYFRTEDGTQFLSASPEACFWAPTTEGGGVCRDDDQCRSGACLLQPKNVYRAIAHEKCPFQPASNAVDCRQPADAPNRWQIIRRNLQDTANETVNAFCVNTSQFESDFTRMSVYDGKECPPVFVEERAQTQTIGTCAESDSLGCLRKNQQSNAHRVEVQGENTSVYTCNRCLDTTFNGKPLYVKGWRLMKPTLCKVVKEKIVDSTIDYLEKRQFYSYPGRVGADVLKKLLLEKSGAITPAEYSQFEKMGFGTTALNYSAWPTERRLAWAEKWGKHLDFGDCSVDPGESTEGNPFFDPSENAEICVPNKFPNGTPCPPPGYNPLSGDSPHSFCDSGFCARDTGLCEDGFGTFEDTNGENRADEEGGNGAATTLVQVNTTTLQVRQVGTLENGQTKRRRYTLSTVNDNQLTFFGKTRSVLRMEQTMTTSPDEAVSTFTGRNFLFGFQVPSSEPVTRCPGDSFVDGRWTPSDEECSSIKEVGQLKPALPTPKVCLPSPWTCEDGRKSKGPMCVRKTFFAGPVPVTVQAEVVLDVCLGVGAEVDDQTQEPSMSVTPAIGVVVDLRGGVGGGVGPVELFAGVRASITAIELAFPLSWGTAIEERNTDPDGESIENLYVVKFQRKLDMDITILKLVLSVFAEAGIGWFSVEWEHIVFEFAGIKLKFELASTAIESVKVDLDHPTAAFSATQ